MSAVDKFYCSCIHYTHSPEIAFCEFLSIYQTGCISIPPMIMPFLSQDLAMSKSERNKHYRDMCCASKELSGKDRFWLFFAAHAAADPAGDARAYAPRWLQPVLHVVL